MDTDLAGSTGSTRVALITGAAQGMGAACARRLAADGLGLVLMDTNDDGARSLAAELPRAHAAPGSVAAASDVQAAVDAAVGTFGRLDILVNAAGILRRTDALDIEEEEWEQVLGVNLTGAFLTSRACGRVMREAGWGRIVHFSSTAGKTVSTLGGAHYTASKHGVLGLTRAYAKELAEYGITVNAVCPGLIDTEMVRNTVSPERRQAYAEAFPIHRLGEPREVADLVAYLVSDAAAYITGAALDINGGDLLA